MRAILGARRRDPVLGQVLDELDAVPAPATTDVAGARRRLQHAMTKGAGVVRSADSLRGVRGAVASAKGVAGTAPDAERAELANLVTCAEALLTSAVARTESRGCHVRAEYPDVDAAWRRRLVVSPHR